MWTKGDNALAKCSNFAIELEKQTLNIGTPKEILDTPKENPITPKVSTVLITFKKQKNYGIGIEFDQEHQRRHSGYVG